MKKTLKNKLLIFIPGYNVENTVKDAINSVLDLNIGQILYVDNNSTDSSLNIVNSIKNKLQKDNLDIIKNSKNLGYGGSQKIAFEYAYKNNYKYLIEFASDLQYPYENITELYKKISTDKYCIVFGSRVTKKSHLQQMPFWKSFGNRLFNILNNWAFHFNVSEIHTGFRAYNLNLIKGFNINKCHDDYRWTLDSVLEIQKINSNFSEIPVKALYHNDSKSPRFKELYTVMSYMFVKVIKQILKKTNKLNTIS